jgi:hypothetical protein
VGREKVGQRGIRDTGGFRGSRFVNRELKEGQKIEQLA